jgi:hypothetical protein
LEESRVRLEQTCYPGRGFQWQPKTRPRWYLWDGGFLLVGEGGGEVPAHAHHAIQVFIAVDGKAVIRTTGTNWQEGRGAIVKPDVEHGFNAQGSRGALMFVDAESSEGLWLRSQLMQDITIVPDARVDACAGELRTFWTTAGGARAGDLARLARALAGSPPLRRIDPRDALVQAITNQTNCACRSKTPQACICHRTASRTSSRMSGLPFRRYILWRKVTRAMPRSAANAPSLTRRMPRIRGCRTPHPHVQRDVRDSTGPDAR